MRYWKLPIAVYLFLVFLSGAVVGGLGYRIYSPPLARGGATLPRRGTEEFKRQYMSEMQTRLGLTPDQLQKLSAIADRTNERFNDARSQHNDMIREMREDHMASVRAILTPEQRPKYDQLRAERELRAKQAKTR